MGSHDRIIFGYGDMLDEYYNIFQLDEDCEYTKHLKSHYYAREPFKRLRKFVEDGIVGESFLKGQVKDFEVFILGHSCGRTDRTLLNYIFEHENCHNIRVFHYNNFQSTNDNIARNFKKIPHYFKMVNEEDCIPMPQK